MQPNKIKSLMLDFESLSIYRDLLKDEVIEKLYSLIEYLYLDGKDLYKVFKYYNEFYSTLLKKANGQGLKDYIIEKILFSENIFAKLSAKEGFDNIKDEIKLAISNDLDSLERISSLSVEDIRALINEKIELNSFEREKVDSLGRYSFDDPMNEFGSDFEKIFKKFKTTSPWKNLLSDLTEFHQKNGWGIFARYKGFLWSGKELKPIASTDPIRLDDLINYERQKRVVVENTLAFLKGFRVNNVLLYGAKGTGKSSMVKAILNEYHHLGLRMVEIPKSNFHTFPDLIEILKDVPLHFIIFIDDLSFESDEDDVSSLKALLEGSLEAKPDNVLIYATSNRRHLVQERFSERLSVGDDDVHVQDTIQEKLSLVDRFGIVVTFSSPTQEEYLKIVDELATRSGIFITEDLHKQAIQWEMNYHGRSPRSARQFMDWYVTTLNNEI